MDEKSMSFSNPEGEVSFGTEDIDIIASEIESIGKSLAAQVKENLNPTLPNEQLLDDPKYLKVVLCFELLKMIQSSPEIRETLVWLYRSENRKCDSILENFEVKYDKDTKTLSVVSKEDKETE